MDYGLCKMTINEWTVQDDYMIENSRLLLA